MRKWIDIISEDNPAPAVPFALQEAIAIIVNHITELRIADTTMQKLMTAIPRPNKAMTVYRVEPMLKTDIANLRNGVQNKRKYKFYSWTTNLRVAKTIAMEMKINAYDDPQFYDGNFCMVVIKETFGPENIVVDIEEFYYEHRDQMSQKAQQIFQVNSLTESEVIIYEPTPRIMTNQNTKVLGDGVMNTIKRLLGF